MKNLEIAGIFYELADILEIKEVKWKPRAYRKAASAIETGSKDVEKIYEKGGLKALKKIPGVGEAIAGKIEEFIKTGKIKEYERLKKSVPAGIEKITDVPGMGPKKALLLIKKLKIKSIKDLEKAAKEGKIRRLSGFGEKSEEDILKGIDLLKSSAGKMLLGKALPISQDLIKELKNLKEVKQINIAGSTRRRKEVVRDLDILCVSSNPKKVMDFFTKLSAVSSVIAKGSTKSSVRLKSGINCDFRVVEEKSFGAALQYFTGSKDHNIRCRQIAIKKGMKLSEYGLFKKKSDKYVCGRTEKEVYKKLGMQFVEPELRENRGEVEAALKNKLPKLIGYGDIKGDLQMHTRYSDGANSIEDMARAAKEMGYEYIAITDHSKSEYIAHGMDEKRLSKYMDEIDKVNKKLKGIRILKGAEVDILKDGSLDYADKYLKKLDIVLAAVHSRFKSSEKEMTRRILKALENRHVNILAHPTGRVIGKRKQYSVNLGKVFDACRDNTVWPEINAFPSRLDLNDSNAKYAVEKGLKLTINTDSHSTDQLRYMEFGIATARRGWARKKDIINTLPWKKFEKLI
ncbi:DNA polymerase/3'-5' exonuclease PolX [Candidatus Woesearchaeota archaeon]|nr:DNA polymerase/3'-5' exonuclease PolX [Candidatus Woesearchaeota archaeon]